MCFLFLKILSKGRGGDKIALFFFSFFSLLWNGGHLILTHFNFSFFFTTFGLPGQPSGSRWKGDSLGEAKKNQKKKPTTTTATKTATGTKQRKTREKN